MTLSERELDLIEVALECAAQSVQSGASLHTPHNRNLDPLAAEYLHALESVERMRKETVDTTGGKKL